MTGPRRQDTQDAAPGTPEPPLDLARDAVIARLREAARRTAQARQARSIAKTRRALARVDLSAVDVSLAASARALLAELDQRSDCGDRWALGRELDDLLRAGCPSVRLARLLIRAGVRPGTQTVRDVRRALVWIRKERQRFRRASRQTEALRSGDGAGERRGPRVLVRRTVETEIVSETLPLSHRE
jgi:hypothetical protein